MNIIYAYCRFCDEITEQYHYEDDCDCCTKCGEDL